MLVAVLITCHNRKEKTLKCLNLMFRQNGINESFKIEVFLVDDGCTDGTQTAVREIFPQVNIIKGTGNLYWNGGMNLAWRTATKTKVYNYYIWLNDDTFLFENAFLELLSYNKSDAIICGSTMSYIDENFSYGGYINRIPLIPNGQFQNCDYSNGNIILISKNVFDKNGFLDDVFTHALGDFDYTQRAKKIGIDIVIAPNWSGFCEHHKQEPNWIREKRVLFRLRNLYNPLSGCSPKEFFIFEFRHNGLLLALLHYFSTHFRCLFPKAFDFLKGSSK
jgi:glycosyltransferase involved in cell wall biosynthesis